jgi:hypothetical protein
MKLSLSLKMSVKALILSFKLKPEPQNLCQVRVCGLQFAYRVELHAPAEENNPTNIGLLKGKGNEVKGKG